MRNSALPYAVTRHLSGLRSRGENSLHRHAVVAACSVARYSGNWRVVFRFEDGEAVDVDLVDYH